MNPLNLSHAARKRFGQHFLIDQSVIEAIVQAIAPTQNEVMVEIGPGLGALTYAVLPHLSHLHVVEVDRDLAAAWREAASKGNTKLNVHEADALKFNFAELCKPKLRVIGNLPYNISSPLLFHLMHCADNVMDQHFMLQKEVVQRMAAQPGTKDFGRLSVMLQARYFISHLFDVPPAAFDPPPRVDSAIVRMIPMPQPLLSEAEFTPFSQLVATAFSQRRKMLRNTLAQYQDKLDFTNFDLTRRAEDVPVLEYVNLAKQLAQL